MKETNWNEGLLILKLAGYNANKAKEILSKLGFKEDNKPLKLTPLMKSLFYNDAYKLALKLKEEKLNWNSERIRKEIKEKLGIWIPKSTVYFWITGRSKPNITPLRICPELGYVIGALMSDCTWSSKVKLKVKDEDFAKEFVCALSKVTGREYRVKREKDGYYVVRLHGSPLRYIVESGLWKVIAYLFPKEFLQGIFDGDGGVSVCIENRPYSGPRFRVQITLTNTNSELLEYVKRLLKKFGIEFSKRIYFKQGKIKVIKGKEYLTKRECWEMVIERQRDVIKFNELISFKIKRKQKKLRDAVEILRRYKLNRERVRAWIELYTKVKNKWVPTIFNPVFNNNLRLDSSRD